MRILRWLTFSKRPMSIEEIAEVIAIDMEREPAFDRDEVLQDPLEALNICSSLVTITKQAVQEEWQLVQRTIITLAHYSVQEYLVLERIKQGQSKPYSMQAAKCHSVVAEDYLKYLLQFQQLLSTHTLEEFALARYTVEFWSSHFRKIGDDTDKVSQVAMRLMSRKQPAYLAWIRLCDPNESWRRPDFTRRLESTAGPLYYAALLGLCTIARKLLDQGAEVNTLERNSSSSALHAASSRGHEQVVKILLDAGADVNTEDILEDTALEIASKNGYEQIVKILLEAGANVDAKGRYSTALWVASGRGHEQIVKILLDAGANVNAQSRKGTALEIASSKGHESIVQLLIDGGAIDYRRARSVAPADSTVDTVDSSVGLRD